MVRGEDVLESPTDYGPVLFPFLEGIGANMCAQNDLKVQLSAKGLNCNEVNCSVCDLATHCRWISAFATIETWIDGVMCSGRETVPMAVPTLLGQAVLVPLIDHELTSLCVDPATRYVTTQLCCNRRVRGGDLEQARGRVAMFCYVVNGKLIAVSQYGPYDGKQDGVGSANSCSLHGSGCHFSQQSWMWA